LSNTKKGGAVVDVKVRVIPKLRQAVDAERLAAALLDFVDQLSNEDREKFIAEGERVLRKVKARPKGRQPHD